MLEISGRKTQILTEKAKDALATGENLSDYKLRHNL